MQAAKTPMPGFTSTSQHRSRSITPREIHPPLTMCELRHAKARQRVLIKRRAAHRTLHKIPCVQPCTVPDSSSWCLWRACRSPRDLAHFWMISAHAEPSKVGEGRFRSKYADPMVFTTCSVLSLLFASAVSLRLASSSSVCLHTLLHAERPKCEFCSISRLRDLGERRLNKYGGAFLHLTASFFGERCLFSIGI